MITASTPVALIMPTQAEIALFMQALSACGLKKVTTFTSTHEAYEVATRQQFPIFVTRMEMPTTSGIVLIQKLRLTGNYGLEPHMFVCDKLDSRLLNVLAEYDLDYVLTAPYNVAAITEKLKHMINSENNLPKVEAQYRDAKSAFSSGLDEMAEEGIKGVLAEAPNLEKAILLFGDTLLKRNDFEAAREQYKKALAVNPKSAAAAHKLAQLLTAQGDHTQAADLLNRLAEISPFSIKLLENAGLSNFTIERYDEAKRHMSRLTAIDEKNKTASTMTAEIKIKTGDFDGIVDVLSKSHDEKAVIQFLNNAGARLSKGDDIDGALKMYTAALEQITDSKFLYAIHYNMAIAYRKKKQIDKTKSHLEKALKINPTFEKAMEILEELAKKGA